MRMSIGYLGPLVYVTFEIFKNLFLITIMIYISILNVCMTYFTFFSALGESFFMSRIPRLNKED